MTTDQRFRELVSLACHDLRTPLATVAGFAATLLRAGTLDSQSQRYVSLMESAAGQLGEIIDDLSALARIEGGRYEPSLEAVDALELAQEAAARVGADKVRVTGEGGPVRIDPRGTTRALAALTRAALRYGALDRIEMVVDGADVVLSPVSGEALEVVLGDSPQDLGAVAGRAVVEALGGHVDRRGETVHVSLPRAQ